MHQHRHEHADVGSVLKWSLAVTVAFVVIEFAAGLQAHSLALLADAGHNLTDALALLLAWFGSYLSLRPPNEIKTYGYQRAGVLSAFVNAIALLALAGYIFWESYERLVRPAEKVHETTMLAVAGLGLLVNAGIMWGLRHERAHDINIQSAWAHMLGDALGSVGIIAGALAIRQTGWRQIDPILSILIGLLIIWTAWGIVKESLNILLEGLPRGMRLKKVIESMREVEGVLDVHDLHIWSLGSSTHALSSHVLIEDMPPSASDSILRRLNQMLCDRFQIRHTTIQFEHVNCAVYENGCSIPVNRRENRA